MRLPHPVQRFVRPNWGAPHASATPSTALRGPSEAHLRPQWCVPHASPPPSTAFRGPIRGSAEGPRGAVRMRLPHPALRFVAPFGAPPKVPVAQSACVSPTT
eukprot:1744819-Pyramimonas_sp.AAC.1